MLGACYRTASRPSQLPKTRERCLCQDGRFVRAQLHSSPFQLARWKISVNVTPGSLAMPRTGKHALPVGYRDTVQLCISKLPIRRTHTPFAKQRTPNPKADGHLTALSFPKQSGSYPPTFGWWKAWVAVLDLLAPCSVMQVRAGTSSVTPLLNLAGLCGILVPKSVTVQASQAFRTPGGGLVPDLSGRDQAVSSPSAFGLIGL